jgi:hypothetical protein
MIVLADLENRQRAMLLVGQLQARGVCCELSEAGCVSVDPDVFEEAFQILVDADLVGLSPWTGGACPACGGHRVQDIGVNWKRASWFFLFFAVCLFGLPLRWHKRTHHCLACGAGWEVAR